VHRVHLVEADADEQTAPAFLSLLLPKISCRVLQFLLFIFMTFPRSVLGRMRVLRAAIFLHPIDSFLLRSIMRNSRAPNRKSRDASVEV
jgi:hypothetical protein